MYEKIRHKDQIPPISNAVACDGTDVALSQSTRKILGELALALHTSSSAGLFVLPYFIRAMIDEKNRSMGCAK